MARHQHDLGLPEVRRPAGEQLPDGGWNIYTGGPAEVNATIKAYLALKLAGVPVTASDPAVRPWKPPPKAITPLRLV